MSNQNKCLRKKCGHVWIRRSIKLPKVCPNCHSPWWNEPEDTDDNSDERDFKDNEDEKLPTESFGGVN